MNSSNKLNVTLVESPFFEYLSDSSYEFAFVRKNGTFCYENIIFFAFNKFNENNACPKLYICFGDCKRHSVVLSARKWSILL